MIPYWIICHRGKRCQPASTCKTLLGPQVEGERQIYLYKRHYVSCILWYWKVPKTLVVYMREWLPPLGRLRKEVWP